MRTLFFVGRRWSLVGATMLVVGGAVASFVAAWPYVAWDNPNGSNPISGTNASLPRVDNSSRQTTDQFPGWPKLHGPTGHNTSPETGLNFDWPESGPEVVWERSIGAGYSAPVVTDAGLLLMHRVENVERLECLDPESGTNRWTCEYATRYQCPVRYSSGPYSTPVISDDLVYAQSAEGALRCVEMATGNLVWKRELSREYDVPATDWGVGHSPCVSEGRVYLNLGGVPAAGVISLDARSGESLWTATDYRASYATPVTATIHGVPHLFVFNAEGCVSLDPDNGRERWFVKFGIGQRTGSANAVTPLVSGDLLLLTAGPGPGCLCLRVLPDGGYEQVWRERRVLDSQFNNQVYLDGLVYGFTSKWQGESHLVCLDLVSGRPRWKWKSNLGRGSALAADGRLILLGEEGNLAVLDATPAGPVSHSTSSEPLLAAPCYSAPALHRGLLYIRNEQRLLCLSLRK